MLKQKLILYKTLDGDLRCVIKNNHGRVIYLELGTTKANTKFTVRRCLYLDRVRGSKYYATPQKLVTKHFNQSDILDVVATELDRQYYGIEFSDELSEIPTEEFIKYMLNKLRRGYKFLIFVGESGTLVNGLPPIITTRLANKIHRKIYLKIKYKDGRGVIEDCHYYDRVYKEKSLVVPESLSTVHFPYNKQSILNIVNNELNADFTHIIFITDNSINIDDNVALCGNI